MSEKPFSRALGIYYIFVYHQLLRTLLPMVRVPTAPQSADREGAASWVSKSVLLVVRVGRVGRHTQALDLEVHRAVRYL